MAATRFLFLVAQVITLALAAVTDSTPPAIIVTCFNCGKGVDRSDAVGAANQMCAQYWKTKLYENDPATDNGFVYNYHYSDKTIQLKFVPFWDKLGCTFDFNTFFLNSTNCYYTFMAPIDYCDTDGVNSKHGGYYLNMCGNATINPNPSGGDGCPNSKPNWSPSNIRVIDHYATDEEHFADSAAGLAFEKTEALDLGLETQ